MSLNIKNEETHSLAAELAKLTGENMTKAITTAIQERLAREKRRRQRDDIAHRLMEIGRRCATLPVLDDREPDAILGYDEHGLPS